MKPIKLTVNTDYVATDEYFPGKRDRIIELIECEPSEHSYVWIGLADGGKCFGHVDGPDLERLAVSILKEFGWEITE